MEVKRRSPKLIAIVFSMAFAALLLIGAAELLAWNNMSNKNSLSDIDTNGYQAVFLSNGQVYFGKLQGASSEYVKLTDVWYLRASETDTSTPSNKIQESSGDSANATIIKLGNEVHGPKDAMLISKNQVLFYENLKDDGKVMKAIKGTAK